jgi:hypothetical protein
MSHRLMDPNHFLNCLKNFNFKKIGKFSFLKNFFQFSQGWGHLKHQKLLRIYQSVWHRKPGGDPFLIPDLISESWTLLFLHCKWLCMALTKCILWLVRTNKVEAWRLQDVKGRVLTPRRLLNYCLWQFKAYLSVPNPLGGQLIKGVA